MEYLHREDSWAEDGCEVIIGKSSWDPNELSLKYAAQDKNGHITRQGEIPLRALPQMMQVVINYYATVAREPGPILEYRAMMQ